MLENLTTVRDLLLVCIGFGLIVFVHELGHFLAARWAGIRVLAFAIGFGPALFSWRKGMGFRAGSGEKEYLEVLKKDKTAGLVRRHDQLSPTEYRFNILPLGGYVKMLGQDDTNPNAISDAPDSYQMCKPTKRMVVISAGVIMNIITAALLFIGVFMAGLPVEPAKIGVVAAGSPAATTPASNAAEAGVAHPGLLPGDEVVSVNGRTPHSFNYVTLEVAMAAPGDVINMTVRRPGVTRPLNFSIKPEPGKLTGLLELGIGPSASTQLAEVKPSEVEAWKRLLASAGVTGVEPGAELVRVGNQSSLLDGNDIAEAVRRSGGKPFEIELRNPDGSSAVATVMPVPERETDFIPKKGKTVTPV
jgi:regulator of sigma E protease